jgi:hypothetical protein
MIAIFVPLEPLWATGPELPSTISTLSPYLVPKSTVQPTLRVGLSTAATTTEQQIIFPVLPFRHMYQLTWLPRSYRPVQTLRHWITSPTPPHAQLPQQVAGPTPRLSFQHPRSTSIKPQPRPARSHIRSSMHLLSPRHNIQPEISRAALGRP